MARYADIRIFLTSVLPGATYSELCDVLGKIKLTQPQYNNEQQSSIKTQSGHKLLIVNVDKEKYIIGRFTFMYTDIKRVQEEYKLLSENVNKNYPLLISSFLTPAIVDQVGGVNIAGALAGRIQSIVVKRYYNWARLGATDNIRLDFSHDNNPIGSFDITNMSHDSKTLCFNVAGVLKNKSVFTKATIISVPPKRKRGGEDKTAVKEMIATQEDAQPKSGIALWRLRFAKSLFGRLFA